jgi:integrase
MLFRLVRPMNRSGSSVPQFVQRIPNDVRARAIGRTLDVPLGAAGTVSIRVTDRMASIRFSLRTRHPMEVKARQATAAAHLERVWQALRRDRPVVLTNRDAHALAGELYRAWADGRRDSDLSATHDPVTGEWVIERPNQIPPEVEEQAFAAAAQRLTEAAERDGLEATLGPVVDRLLLRKGIAAVDPECRPMLLSAFLMALQDAFANRERNAAGDFTPDPKAARFPEWPSATGSKDRNSSGVSITGLIEGWWAEAKARGLKPSTHESYRNTAAGLVAFVRHDDASRITPDDILRFKDHRLASVHPRTGKPISAKTVKDSDLAGLKAMFGWAVANRKLPTNPAAGITIKVGKPVKLRSKGFTDEEARAILKASRNYRPSKQERVQTAAAKRWVPWLCAYTGARVGEMVQLRKQDVRQVGDLWVLRITPEAGTVKTNEAREVVLHLHLIEQGFSEFVANAPAQYLFLRPATDGDVLGPWQGVKNRLQEFARAIVTDRNVAPNHGWRHRFKTVGMEAGIPPRILDAIQGQAPATVADSYGEVTLRTMADGMAKVPWIEV